MQEKTNNEVMERLEILGKLGAIGVNKSVTKEIPLKKFFDFNELPVSVDMCIGGILYKGHQHSIYSKIEPRLVSLKATGWMPYYVIVEGESIISVLVVSPYESDWDEEREMLKNKEAYAACFHIDDDDMEIGLIGFTVRGGGLVRIW